MTLLGGRRIAMLIESALRIFPSSSSRVGALRLSRFTSPGVPSPKFSVEDTSHDIRNITVLGDQPRITQALLESIRSLPGPLGVVFVVVEESSNEWIVSSIPRQKVLQGLFTVRDLLGAGGVDLAVFSSAEGVEIFLDRFGTLEFRCEAWWEPRLRSILSDQGFRLVPQLSTPITRSQEVDWDPEESTRLEFVRRSFGMKQVGKQRTAR